MQSLLDIGECVEDESLPRESLGGSREFRIRSFVNLAIRKFTF